VLADLARRDLIPEVWVPSVDERANRERLRRRAHLIRLRTSAINRTFGLLTQWGLRRNLTALRKRCHRRARRARRPADLAAIDGDPSRCDR
jgi:hypothetical protein